MDLQEISKIQEILHNFLHANFMQNGFTISSISKIFIYHIFSKFKILKVNSITVHNQSQ